MYMLSKLRLEYQVYVKCIYSAFSSLINVEVQVELQFLPMYLPRSSVQVELSSNFSTSHLKCTCYLNLDLNIKCV